MSKIYLFLSLVLFYSCSVGQFNLLQVEPYQKVMVGIPVELEKKQIFIKSINNGNFKLHYKGTHVRSRIQTALKGERVLFAFEVQNKDKQVRKFEIYHNIPEKHEPQLYQMAFINDWYSSNPNKENCDFFGDPLINIQNGFEVQLMPNETGRFYLEIISSISGEYEFQMNVRQLTTNKRLKFQVQVLDADIPKIPFPSIAFNSINAHTSQALVEFCEDIGFTHLQCNYIPTVYFDENGNPLSGIDFSTQNSIGYKATVRKWIASGNKALLFWQPRYAKLAPTKSGTFLTPYTKPWLKAFSTLLNIIDKDLSDHIPHYNSNQLLIYLIDEVSQNLRGDNLRNYQSLAKHLKNNNAYVKIFASFGIHSDKNDIQHIAPWLDVLMYHYAMPEKVISKGIKFLPLEVKTNVRTNKSKNAITWAYHVARGKTSNLREFSLLPIMSALEGDKGFSWWALMSHRGSSWTADDSGGLDYSLLYVREPNNVIYQQWVKHQPNVYLPTIRSKTLQRGLISAKIVAYLKKNIHLLSEENHQLLSNLQSRLQTQSVILDKGIVDFRAEDEKVYQIENKLRQILAEIN